MKISNTRAVTGLYIASYKTKNAIGGKVLAIAAFGKINGQPQQLFSLVPRLNGPKIPALREMRGILEGRTIVLAAEVIAFEEQSSAPVSADLVVFTSWRTLTPKNKDIHHPFEIRIIEGGSIYVVKFARNHGPHITLGPFTSQDAAEAAIINIKG